VAVNSDNTSKVKHQASVPANLHSPAAAAAVVPDNLELNSIIRSASVISDVLSSVDVNCSQSTTGWVFFILFYKKNFGL